MYTRSIKNDIGFSVHNQVSSTVAYYSPTMREKSLGNCHGRLTESAVISTSLFYIKTLLAKSLSFLLPLTPSGQSTYFTECTDFFISASLVLLNE